jgi:hypothetical protein
MTESGDQNINHSFEDLLPDSGQSCPDFFPQFSECFDVAEP